MAKTILGELCKLLSENTNVEFGYTYEPVRIESGRVRVGSYHYFIHARDRATLFNMRFGPYSRTGAEKAVAMVSDLYSMFRLSSEQVVPASEGSGLAD